MNKNATFGKILAYAAGCVFSIAGVTHLYATDYTLDMKGSVYWPDASKWMPDTGFPGEEDNILSISGDGCTLFLDGGQIVSRLVKSSDDTQYLMNGTMEKGTADTLSIGQELQIENGFLYIRSNSEGERITLLVPSLRLGQDIDGTTGRVSFGGAKESDRHIHFQVSGTTTLSGYNPAVILGEGLTREDANIDLGHVVAFATETSTSGTPGLYIGSGALTVKSLRSGGTGLWKTFFVRQNEDTAGTLVIDGDTDDPNQSEEANDYGFFITEGVRVEKTGSNLQIFSRVEGNDYSGGSLIAGGVLAVRNSTDSGLGSGPVEIRDGGALAGNGQVALVNATLTVKAKGLLAPGADNEGEFNKLRLNGGKKGAAKLSVMESGAAFAFRVNASGESDEIAFEEFTSGDLDLASDGVFVNVSGSLAANVPYTLLTFKSADGNPVASGLRGGLLAGTGFEGFTPTFHYDDPKFGGRGVITMTVTPTSRSVNVQRK